MFLKDFASTASLKMDLKLDMSILSNIPSTPTECAWYCDGRMLHIQKSRFSAETMVLFKSEWAKGKVGFVANFTPQVK